jgi:hypothetical protein
VWLRVTDDLVSVAPLPDRCAGRFADLIETEPSAEALSALRAAETIGRPLGSAAFLDRLAALMRPRSASETARPEAESRGIESIMPCPKPRAIP